MPILIGAGLVLGGIVANVAITTVLRLTGHHTAADWFGGTR